MNKEDFIKHYCKESGIKQEELLKTQIVLPCNCGDTTCEGWAMVSNNKLSIKSHKKLYT